MKIKNINLVFILVLSLIFLGGCKKIDQPQLSQKLKQTEKRQQNQSSSFSTSDSEKTKEEAHDLKAEAQFVQQFLDAYTNYSSVNTQKAAIQPYLTEDLKENLAVGQLSSPDLNRVTSKGEQLSLWHNDEGKWLGLVAIKINEQISNVHVFVIGLENKEGRYLVQQFHSPTQE